MNIAHCLRGALTAPLIRETMVKHQLFEELEAFDPRYAQRYRTLRDAAIAADCLPLFLDYLRSAQGQAYATEVAAVPDALGAIEAAQESADRLPYTLTTIGLTGRKEHQP